MNLRIPILSRPVLSEPVGFSTIANEMRLRSLKEKRK